MLIVEIIHISLIVFTQKPGHGANKKVECTLNRDSYRYLALEWPL